MKIQPSICLDDWGKPRKNHSQVGRHRDSNPGPPECESRALISSLLDVKWKIVSIKSLKSFGSWKFSFQSKTVCWLVVELKEKNSILGRNLNPGLYLHVLVRLPLRYPGQVLIHVRINLFEPSFLTSGLTNSVNIFLWRHHHHSVLPKGRSFTANSGTTAAVLPKGRSSTANSGTKVAVLLGINRYGSFLLLSAPHSLISILTDLKRSEKGTIVEVRRVDLANWALRTSPKFTTGVKYHSNRVFFTRSEIRKSQSPFAPPPVACIHKLLNDY